MDLLDKKLGIKIKSHASTISKEKADKFSAMIRQTETITQEKITKSKKTEIELNRCSYYMVENM